MGVSCQLLKALPPLLRGVSSLPSVGRHGLLCQQGSGRGDLPRAGRIRRDTAALGPNRRHTYDSVRRRDRSTGRGGLGYNSRWLAPFRA